MKVDTPQILWHSDADGKAAPLYSISLLSSGLSMKEDEYGTVVATAGNSSDIHLWRVNFDSSNNNGIQLLASLSRHERSVNVVAFSPNGIHLVSAGDGGSLILWSVPQSKRGNGNGCHFWGTYLQEEKDLDLKILPSSNCQDIMDLSWSADSQRFMAGSIDRCITIWELNNDTHNWTCVYRNAKDHGHYVQGVALDPLGVYMASQGSDRSVKVYTSSSKKNHPSKAKTIKFRNSTNNDNNNTKRHHLFADESTVESFFRRLSWTSDGAFLISPAGLWHKADDDAVGATPSFATLLFARHNFDQPYKVLTGLEKPSVVVRPNPIRFQLPINSETKIPNMRYRSIFAVLTLDTILIYDTHHSRPLAIAKGLHYATLTDCAWTEDGHKLMVTSTDGYISILTFVEGELGSIYHADSTPITIVAPPTKKTRIATTNSSTKSLSASEHQTTTTKTTTELVQNMSLQSKDKMEEPAKKKQKKRIQPILVTL